MGSAWWLRPSSLAWKCWPQNREKFHKLAIFATDFVSFWDPLQVPFNISGFLRIWKIDFFPHFFLWCSWWSNCWQNICIKKIICNEIKITTTTTTTTLLLLLLLLLLSPAKIYRWMDGWLAKKEMFSCPCPPKSPPRFFSMAI